MFCQEARNVAELQQTVQTGKTLLRRKEEQLQQLESSIADEVRIKHCIVLLICSSELTHELTHTVRAAVIIVNLLP